MVPKFSDTDDDWEERRVPLLLPPSAKNPPLRAGGGFLLPIRQPGSDCVACSPTQSCRSHRLTYHQFASVPEQIACGIQKPWWWQKPVPLFLPPVLPTLDGWVVFEQLEVAVVLRNKHAVVYKGFEMGTGRLDLNMVFALIDLTELVDSTVLPNLDLAVLRLGVDIKQNPIVSQAGVYSAQGVHDALKRNASQRVGQDRYVKAIGFDLHLQNVQGFEGHLPAQVRRACFDGMSDPLLVEVEGDHFGGFICISPRQPAIATANLEDSGAIEIHQVMYDACFYTVPVNRYVHHFSSDSLTANTVSLRDVI